MVAPANYGFASTREPVQGWRYAPQLDAAAGVAPRDPFITVYDTTPAGSNQAKQTFVPPVLMLAYQQDKTQFVATGPVGFVPGGTAVLEQTTTEGQ